MNRKRCLLSCRTSRHTSAAQRHSLGENATAAGCLVRLRAGLVHPGRGGYGAVPHLCVSRLWLDPVAACLVPVTGSDDLFLPHGPCPPCSRWHGVDPGNLRPLCRDPLSAACPDPPAPARFGLANARLLANKTFILKDFFTSRGLDFLFVTETWLSAGESCAFTELLPAECRYFNSPRTSGRGGRIATIFKRYRCHWLSPALN